MRKETIRIVCEAEESVLEKFIQRINVKTDLMLVEHIEIVKSRLQRRIQYFDIKYEPLEKEVGEVWSGLQNCCCDPLGYKRNAR
jgi:hypothetical protein